MVVVVVVVSDLWIKTVGRITMIIFLSFPKPFTKMEKQEERQWPYNFGRVKPVDVWEWTYLSKES